MSIASVVTRGFGSFGSVSLLVARGFVPAIAAPAVLATLRQVLRVGVSAPDPYLVAARFASYRACTGIPGRTIADPRLADGETTAVLVAAGGSMICNSVDTPYTPTHATKVDNLDLHDGGTWRAIDPLLGCGLDASGNTGNILGRVADKLIDLGVCERVILIPAGLGDTAADDWNSSAELRDRLIVAGRRAAAVGLTVTAFLWVQGERDGVLGTTQSAYEASLTGLIDRVRAAGFAAPWLIGRSTYAAGASSSAIRAAQAAVVNGTDILAGADTDSLTGGTYRQADVTHWKAAGADAAAALWASAIDAAL